MENKNRIAVREMVLSDIPLLVAYWLASDPDHLVGMGVDLDKLPPAASLTKMLSAQIDLPIEEKQSYALIWLFNEFPIGHCNVNTIEFGKQANMHLHIWQSSQRQKGIGIQLVKMSLPYFFENLKLEMLFCEPYALNPAPNKTLERVGFAFEKEYITIPGSLNFEQPVKRWKLIKEKYKEIEIEAGL